MTETEALHAFRAWLVHTKGKAPGTAANYLTVARPILAEHPQGCTRAQWNVLDLPLATATRPAQRYFREFMETQGCSYGTHGDGEPIPLTLHHQITARILKQLDPTKPVSTWTWAELAQRPPETWPEMGGFPGAQIFRDIRGTLNDLRRGGAGSPYVFARYSGEALKAPAAVFSDDQLLQETP